MRCLVVLLALVACSDERKAPDAATKDAPVDAKRIDAPPDAQAFVLKVDCASSTPVQTVIAPGGEFKFIPQDITIALNDVVKFSMVPASGHSVTVATSLPTDPGLIAGFGIDTCLKFTKAGTFSYVCNPHGFPGSVTVTP